MYEEIERLLQLAGRLREVHEKETKKILCEAA
jgi:hypothetical protein